METVSEVQRAISATGLFERLTEDRARELAGTLNKDAGDNWTYRALAFARPSLATPLGAWGVAAFDDAGVFVGRL